MKYVLSLLVLLCASNAVADYPLPRLNSNGVLVVQPISAYPICYAPRYEWQTRAVVVTEWSPWYGLVYRIVYVNVLVRVA